MDNGSTEPINSVVPDEDLVNQVVPDEEELFNEEETSPTPTLGSIPVNKRLINGLIKYCGSAISSFRASSLTKLLPQTGSHMPWAALRSPCGGTGYPYCWP